MKQIWGLNSIESIQIDVLRETNAYFCGVKNLIYQR